MLVTQSQISENFALLAFSRKVHHRVSNCAAESYLSFMLMRDKGAKWAASLTRKRETGGWDTFEAEGPLSVSPFNDEFNMWQAIKGQEILDSLLRPWSATLHIPAVAKRIELMDMHGHAEFFARQERLKKEFRNWLSTFARAYGLPVAALRVAFATAGLPASSGLCLVGSISFNRPDGTTQTTRLRAYAGALAENAWAIVAEPELRTEDPEEVAHRTEGARQTIFREHGLIETKVY